MINPNEVEFLELNKGWKALVDADIYSELSKYKWTITKRGRTRVYAKRGFGPAGKSKYIYLHHAILPPKPGFTVDHHNSEHPFCVLDERRSNLRYATKQQQQHNRRKSILNKGKFKGVNQLPSGRYCARMKVSGEKRCIGTFDTEEQAAKAYDVRAIKHHGEFAKLNFPESK